MEGSKQTHWIPLADLMTGLMMIFMLISAVYISKVDPTTTLVLDQYAQTRKDLHLALQQEFEKDFRQWNASLLGDMTVRFNNPSVQFTRGSVELTPEFQQLLTDFFPRYLRIIRGIKFKNSVKEIRIEGHTSKAWQGVSDREAYFLNMDLSQQRTRSTLKFIMTLPIFAEDENWFKQHITANGLSSSKPVESNPKTLADDDKNQRVEFRIVTNASDRFEQLISTR